jgi:hypothetical protein
MVLSFDPLTCFHGRPGLPDFSWLNIPKTLKSIPNYHKITKWLWNIPNVQNVFHMRTKYTNIFPCMALQNLPKLGILVWKKYDLATLRQTSLTLIAPKISRKPALRNASVKKRPIFSTLAINVYTNICLRRDS